MRRINGETVIQKNVQIHGARAVDNRPHAAKLLFNKPAVLQQFDGRYLVATLTTALRNLFCDGPPTGAVSMTADVFRTLMPFVRNKPMACPMFPARSPRFEPNPMYAMLNDSLRINPYKTFFNRSTASCRRSLGTVRAMRIYPSPASPKPLPGVTTMSALSKNALPVSMELENPFGIFAQT